MEGADTPMVDRLKLELKRALRKRMTEAVNDVCKEFEHELAQTQTPPEPPLKVAASAFESDYDCCRRLVDYIARNMDTSPSFAQQMDCVILAYQSNASAEILNAVVTQDLWFRKRACCREKTGESGKEVDKDPVEKEADILAVNVEKAREGKNNGEVKPAPPKIQQNCGPTALPPTLLPVRVDKPSVADRSHKKSEPKIQQNRGPNGLPPQHQLTHKKAEAKSAMEDIIKLSSSSSPSKPRQWAKRKRLSTKSRSRSTSQPSKRSRNEMVQKRQPVETVDEICIDDGESEDTDDLLSKGDDRVGDETIVTNGDIGDNDVVEVSDDKFAEHPDSVAAAAPRTEVLEEKKSSDTLPSVNPLSEQDDFDAQYRHMESDLKASDDSFVLAVAHARFQAVIDDMIQANERPLPTDKFVDPIKKLCNGDQKAPDQRHFFKTRLRDTIAIVDALLCHPPPGCVCSRGCKDIRSQMCSKFDERCINPTCGIWHDAETHSANCPNRRCEFRVRVMLRETMHLIEQKQQEVVEALEELATVKTQPNSALLIQTLEGNIEDRNGELIVLNDTKQDHEQTLRSIGIDSSDDVVDKFPDFDSHYQVSSTHNQHKS